MVDILLISLKEFMNSVFMYGLFVDRNSGHSIQQEAGSYVVYR